MSDTNVQTHELIGGLGATALAVATLLPWARQGSSFSENSFLPELPWFLTGTNSEVGERLTYLAHGPVFAGLAVVALLLLYLNRHIPRRAALLGVGGLAMALLLLDLFSFSSLISDVNNARAPGEPEASVGVGMYVALLGAIAIICGAVMAKPPKARLLHQTAPIAAQPSPPPPSVVAQPAGAATSPPSPAPEPPSWSTTPSPRAPETPPTQPGSSGQWWND